jgi:hypothetical protein
MDSTKIDFSVIPPSPRGEVRRQAANISPGRQHVPLTPGPAVQATLVHALTLSLVNIPRPSDHQLTPKPADKRCC